jgi:hypothetical protein
VQLFNPECRSRIGREASGGSIISCENGNRATTKVPVRRSKPKDGIDVYEGIELRNMHEQANETLRKIGVKLTKMCYVDVSPH